MIKRVNSTGRKRIPRNRVTVEVLAGNPRPFKADVNIGDFDAPPDAVVVIEATCAGSNTISRFEWGTVSKLKPPVKPELRDIHGENVFFSLKVIDRSQQYGRLLGVAENIRPLHSGEKTAAGRRGILPVEAADLGNEIWKLEFRSEDVFLLVNEQIPDFADRVKFDPGVFPLIYPSVIREVLMRAFDEQVDATEEDESWPTLWLRFGRRLHPDQLLPPNDGDEDAQQEWLDEVVTSFCKEHKLRERYCQSSTLNQSWEDSA